MTIEVCYCETSDGFGKDLRRTFTLEELSIHSSLPFGVVKAYSIHKQDNNLIDCICKALGIEFVQLIFVQLRCQNTFQKTQQVDFHDVTPGSL